MGTQASSPFSTAEQQALAVIVGQIIPACEAFGQLGADDPKILRDIVTTGSQLHDRLTSALATVVVGKTVDAAQAADFRQAFPAEAELIQILTVQCYYRDARVMRSLNIDVRPPYPDGYTQEPNDFSLLEPVRQRGEIYRKVP